MSGFKISEAETLIVKKNLLLLSHISLTLHQFHFHFSQSKHLKVNCQFREVLLKAT